MTAWNLIFLNGCTAVLPAAHACFSDRGNRIIIPITPNIRNGRRGRETHAEQERITDEALTD